MTQPHLPDNEELSDFWDFLDIVKTQGAYLKPRPPTPNHRRVNVDEFAAKLYDRLEFLSIMLESRRKRYGAAADEWPPGHTPTEIVEKRRAEVERLFALAEAPSPPTPSPSNSEGPPNPAPSCHQSLLPTSASEFAVLEPKPGKKRQRHEDTGEESRRKKSRRVAAKADRQSQLPSPDDTVAEPVAAT
ncbi:hypothetical protein GGR51DRAFT_560662 [Nemania sp. FL0031]|nr:hypothetical protein GGR51DRAFT_560662 [Nemania sp. FL0031]